MSLDWRVGGLAGDPGSLAAAFGKRRRMEGMNPFWFQAYFIGVILGGILLALNIIALVAWLLRRSRATLIIFWISLGCLAAVGAFVVVSLVLIGSRWP